MLLRLVFINFSLTVGVRSLSTFLPVYMAQHGTPVTSIGALFTAMLALGAIASVFVSTLSRRTGKRSLILVSIALGAPLAVGGYLFFGSPAGVVLIIAAGTVLTFSNPLLILMAQKHAGNSPAMASSLIMGLSWGLAGLAMVPLGSLGEAMGLPVMMVVGRRLPPALGGILPAYPAGLSAAAERYSQRYSPATWNSDGPSRMPDSPMELHAPMYARRLASMTSVLRCRPWNLCPRNSTVTSTSVAASVPDARVDTEYRTILVEKPSALSTARKRASIGPVPWEVCVRVFPPRRMTTSPTGGACELLSTLYASRA